MLFSTLYKEMKCKQTFTTYYSLQKILSLSASVALQWPSKILTLSLMAKNIDTQP